MTGGQLRATRRAGVSAARDGPRLPHSAPRVAQRLQSLPWRAATDDCREIDLIVAMTGNHVATPAGIRASKKVGAIRLEMVGRWKTSGAAQERSVTRFYKEFVSKSVIARAVSHVSGDGGENSWSRDNDGKNLDHRTLAVLQDASKAKAVPGRPLWPSPTRVCRWRGFILDVAPRQLSSEAALRTGEIARDVIVRELDVRSSAIGVSRLLRTERFPANARRNHVGAGRADPCRHEHRYRHSLTILSAASAHAQPRPGSCAVRTPAASSAPVHRTTGRSRR